MSKNFSNGKKSFALLSAPKQADILFIIIHRNSKAVKKKAFMAYSDFTFSKNNLDKKLVFTRFIRALQKYLLSCPYTHPLEQKRWSMACHISLKAS